MTETQVSAEVLIIGAGLSGIMAARELQAQGVDVCLVDKSERVGGRMATRSLGPGIADHGAQFFTVRTPEFQEIVDRWTSDGMVFVWSTGFSDGSISPHSTDGHPRHAVHGGANALAQYLAQDLRNVYVNTSVVTATCDESGWILQDEDGNLFLSEALIMTAPVPQSLLILDEGATILTRADHAALSRIEYAPSLTGLFWIEGRITLPQPGAIQRRNSQIAWIADNRHKGISPDATILTVQASEQYSQQMWSAPDERVLSAMRTGLQIFMPDSTQIREEQLKRWRYAAPTVTHEERCLVADNEAPLVFAGDAFGGPRVEGAVLSGIVAAQSLLG